MNAVSIESSFFDSHVVEKRRGKFQDRRLSKRLKTAKEIERNWLNKTIKFDKCRLELGCKWKASGDLSYDWTGDFFDPVHFTEEDSQKIIGMEIILSAGALWQSEYLWTLDI